MIDWTYDKDAKRWFGKSECLSRNSRDFIYEISKRGRKYYSPNISYCYSGVLTNTLAEMMSALEDVESVLTENHNYFKRIRN